MNLEYLGQIPEGGAEMVYENVGRALDAFATVRYTPVEEALPETGGMYSVIYAVDGHRDVQPIYLTWAAEWLPQSKEWATHGRVVAWAKIPAPSNPEFSGCITE